MFFSPVPTGTGSARLIRCLVQRNRHHVLGSVLLSNIKGRDLGSNEEKLANPGSQFFPLVSGLC